MSAPTLRVLALTLSLLFPAAARAQRSTDTPPLGPPAGYLDADHWAVRAAWRAKGMGLAPSFAPAQTLVRLETVEVALREAASARTSAPAMRALAEDWSARFAEEFGQLSGESGDGPAFRVRSATAAMALISHTGRAAPGRGEAPNNTGADPMRDIVGVVASADASVSLGSAISVHVAPWVGPDSLGVNAATVTLSAGPWSASAGRQAVGYGWARGGAVALSGAEPFDLVEVATRRPIRAGGRLSVMGRFGFHTFFSRLSSDRHAREPYFWGARGVWSPHDRLDLAIQRAAMFGGGGERVTARRLGSMLLGRVVSRGFENQIVSASARYRLPTGPALPLTLYAEWGAEDAAGAWRDAPGYVLGVEAPALPPAPELSLGVEYASFAPSCCGNPPWYRHNAFPGNWSGRSAPLGHPLGGNGSELMAHAGAELLDARLRLDGRILRRDRREENLFVPGRDGRATGFSADVAWRFRPRSELHLSVAREAGDGWRESAATAGGRLFLAN